MLNTLLDYFRRPVRFDYLHKYIRNRPLKILDVGCGNCSPSLTKKFYPKCKYYGLDVSTNYNLSEEDFKVMEHFYECDLSKGNLDMIEDFFDCIILSHVIEHTENGEDVILNLLTKVKKEGIIYIEFPSPRSVHLPHMRGTLNFYDDPTHIRLYNLDALKSLLTSNQCLIVKSGVRRSFKRILFLPLYLIASLILYKHVVASVFWDITGFADYIIASKV